MKDLGHRLAGMKCFIVPPVLFLQFRVRHCDLFTLIDERCSIQSEIVQCKHFGTADPVFSIIAEAIQMPFMVMVGQIVAKPRMIPLLSSHPFPGHLLELLIRDEIQLPRIIFSKFSIA